MFSSEILTNVASLLNKDAVKETNSRLRVGVDLGTANIVLVVVDEEGTPIAAVSRKSTVVKDGIVVEYVKAVQIVRELKEELEKKLGKQLVYAACAIPPGINPSTVKAIANVVVAAGFALTNIVDEPTAASKVLKIKNGAIADVGGGTTGVSVFKDGEVIHTADEPTGGVHMTLTVAGYYGVEFEVAEKLKAEKEAQSDVFVIVRPVIEKMAYIMAEFIKGYEVECIYLVGGATIIEGFETVVQKVTGIKTLKAEHALLVTPLGIALSCTYEEM